MLSASNVMAQGEPCTADFNCDQAVAADDVAEFLNQFGRGEYNDPCPDCYDSPCPCTASGCNPPAPVPKTGQITQYSDCDDGYYQAGVESSNPRFTDNGDGTITDTLTGLIWLTDANCFGPRIWAQAASECSLLANGSCGLTDDSSTGDWRLPNLREIQSLIDYGRTYPALPSDNPFANVLVMFGINYWSSTTLAALDYETLAWAVGIDFGEVSYLHPKENLSYVWPVRGGITDSLPCSFTYVSTSSTTSTIGPGEQCNNPSDCGEGYCCCCENIDICYSGFCRTLGECPDSYPTTWCKP
jgi:hypothetical protein